MTDTVNVVTVPVVNTARHTYPTGTRRVWAAFPAFYRVGAEQCAERVSGEVVRMAELDYARLIDRGGIIYPA